MGNYEGIDTFVDIVAKKNEAAELAKRAAEETRKGISAEVIKFAKEYREVARAEAAIAREEERQEEIDRYKSIRIKAISIALAALLTLGITTNFVYGDEISTYMENKNDYDEAVNEWAQHHILVFQARRMHNGWHLNTNTIQQYRDLNITKLEELYVHLYESKMRYSSNFDEEMKKLISSVSYYDEERNICFYKSLDDVLKRNGFANENEFKKAMKKSIIEKWKNGEIVIPFHPGMSIGNKSR